MANGARPPILGSFEDIGEQIVNQVKQLPKDVGQAALESVGMNVGGGKQGGKTTTSTPQALTTEGSPLQQMEQAQSEKEKKELAHSALQWLSGSGEKPKEKSIWEKMQEEDAQKEQAKKQQQAAQANSLPMPKGKSKQGAMGRVNKSKQQGNEMKINMKQD